MLSNLIILVVSFIIVLVIVADLEPAEAWQTGWCLTSEGWKEIQKRDKIKRRINDQKDAELAKLIMNTQAHEKSRKDQELEQRRKAFKEWKANCEAIFKPVAS